MIDRGSPLPLYYQLQRLLLDQIESGQLEPGDELLTEQELIAEHGLSRTTVRRALDELARSGYITREQGRGTFVSAKVEDTRAEKLRGFLEDLSERGVEIGTRILFCGSVPAPPRAAKRLEIESGVPAYLIHRVGLADGEPIGLAEVWLGVDDTLEISREELAEQKVLHTFLESMFQEKYGTRFVSGEKTLEATVATPEEAELLSTLPGAPLLLVRVIMRSPEEKPLVYVKTLYRGDRYVYFTKLSV
jgi:GntR family transcriptional regulator